MEITTRPYDPKIDDPYIYASWTRYSYYSPKKPIKMEKREFFLKKIEEIKEHLEKDHTRVACLKSDPSFILGYIVSRGPEIIWLCVKKDYHRVGIEQLLRKTIPKGEICQAGLADSSKCS